MVYESWPWKQELNRHIKDFRRYNNKWLFRINDDWTYTKIEKSIFYSVFVVRKLIDCTCKVSDEVDRYTFNLKAYKPVEGIDLMHRSPDNDRYDFEHTENISVQGKQICNWLIHSYVFFVGQNEEGIVTDIYVSSDYDRNKLLYMIPVKEWLSYVEFVASDSITKLRMQYNEKKSDYEVKLKKRD